MLVRDIMTEEPISVQTHDTLGTVAELLYQRDIRHVPVVEGNELVGMLSDRDIREFSSSVVISLEYPESLVWENEKVGAVMSSGVVSVGPDASISEVIQLILDYKLSAIPVADDHTGELVGIVSYIDILRTVQEMLD